MSEAEQLADLEIRVARLERQLRLVIGKQRAAESERGLPGDIVAGQFLERLSMIEYQLGLITDHLEITPPADDDAK